MIPTQLLKLIGVEEPGIHPPIPIILDPLLVVLATTRLPTNLSLPSRSMLLPRLARLLVYLVLRALIMSSIDLQLHHVVDPVLCRLTR
jgi:hypothetical protein